MKGARIPMHHYGCKLPHESPSCGTGYAASGEVKTYTLPKEEIQRIFGKASPAEGKAPIILRNPYQREADEKDMMLKADFEKKLPKEKYLELREKGYSDAKMLKELKLPFNAVYHLTKAKKEWGIPGYVKGGRKCGETKQPEINQAVKVDIEKSKAEPTTEVPGTNPDPTTQEMIQRIKERKKRLATEDELPEVEPEQEQCMGIDSDGNAIWKVTKEPAGILPTFIPMPELKSEPVQPASYTAYGADGSVVEEFTEEPEDLTPEPIICDGLTTKTVSVMELLIEVEALNSKMATNQARIDYISGVLERTMVEV